MTWRESLQPASFRGVSFDVEGDSGSFGRRTQLHEYPQRDKPYAEDLGRATRAFEITAFVIGDDYLGRRDALLDALETEGSGTLVHPWYGQLTVSIKDPARVSHSIQHGGMCTFTLSFVEAGELTFPSAASSLGAQTLTAVDAVEVVATQDFVDTFKVDGFPSFVPAAFLADMTEFIGVASGYLDGAQRLLANPLADLLDLVPQTDLTAIADAVIGMYVRGASVLVALTGGTDAGGNVAAVAYGGGSYARNRNAVITLTQLSQAYGVLAGSPSSAAPATYQAQVNRRALAVLFQRSALIQAAGMSAVMPMPVYDDAVLVRDGLATAIDDSSYVAADDVYVVLQVLRARVYADISGRLVQAARLLDYTPVDVMPALALAYDRYEDPTRETELIERNAIRHPGFVPVRSLKVLSA